MGRRHDRGSRRPKVACRLLSVIRSDDAAHRNIQAVVGDWTSPSCGNPRKCSRSSEPATTKGVDSLHGVDRDGWPPSSGAGDRPSGDHRPGDLITNAAKSCGGNGHLLGSITGTGCSRRPDRRFCAVTDPLKRRGRGWRFRWPRSGGLPGSARLLMIALWRSVPITPTCC